jgi:4,5-dihydroxyphthalate decarboxylase
MLPLINSTVKVEGAELAIEILSPEVIFAKAFTTADFDICELSFSNSVTAAAKGEFPYALIPVFLARTFRHSTIIVRTDRGITRPQGLKGKTIGLQEYGMTGAVVIRGMLRDAYGVEPQDIRWRVGEKGMSKPLEFPAGRPPSGVDIAMLPTDRSLEERLEAGELDAAILLKRRVSGATDQSRTAAETEWYAATKIFPIMHAVGVKKSLIKKYSDLGRHVFNAFNSAKAIAISELDVTQAPKVTLPWPHYAINEARALMGRDPWPYRNQCQSSRSRRADTLVAS